MSIPSLTVDLWSHILSYCIEEPTKGKGYACQKTLVNALRVNSTLFLAAAPHLYSKAIVHDSNSFFQGSDCQITTFLSGQQMDYEYLRRGQTKLPLLRHVRHINFCWSTNDDVKETVEPERDDETLWTPIVAEALRTMSRLLSIPRPPLCPRIRVLAFTNPSDGFGYYFSHFLQQSLKLFRPQVICINGFSGAVLSNVFEFSMSGLPNLVVIHGSLDWKLRVMGGTKNRICLVNPRANNSSENSPQRSETLGLAHEIPEWPGINENVAVIATDDEEDSWEDYDDSYSVQTPAELRPESPIELHLGSFDVEDLEDNYYNYGYDVDEDYNFNVDYDEDPYERDFDLACNDMASSIFDEYSQSTYSEYTVIDMFQHLIAQTFSSQTHAIDTRQELIRNTTIEVYGLESYLSVEALADEDLEWDVNDSNETIMSRGLKRIEAAVKLNFATDFKTDVETPTFRLIWGEEMPACDCGGRSSQCAIEREKAPS
ncbi:hypothetical protein L204_106059 [Cryptococcus depauperatus]